MQLTIATGRTLSGVQDLIQKLDEAQKSTSLIKRGTPLILYNGSAVVEMGTRRLLRLNTMAPTTLASVFKTAVKYPCEVYAYFCNEETLDMSVVPGTYERVFAWQFNLKGEARAEREFNGLLVEWEVQPPLLIHDQPCAVVIRTPEPQSLASLAAEFATAENVSATRSGSVYLELRPPGSSKGSALAWVAKQLGLAASEVLAVGDNDNDVEMFKWAGTSVAVNTASNSAREHADFLCDYGPFQGVVQVLRVVHEAHRYCRNIEQNPSI